MNFRIKGLNSFIISKKLAKWVYANKMFKAKTSLYVNWLCQKVALFVSLPYLFEVDDFYKFLEFNIFDKIPGYEGTSPFIILNIVDLKF